MLRSVYSAVISLLEEGNDPVAAGHQSLTSSCFLLPNPAGGPQLRLTLIQSNKEDQKQFSVGKLPFTLLIFCILPTFQGSLKVPAFS